MSSNLQDIPNHTARIRVLLHLAVELIKEPTDLQGWQDFVDQLRREAGYQWGPDDLSQTPTNRDLAWKRTIRIILNRWHHQGELVARVGRSIYAPLHLNSDTFSEQDDIADDDYYEENGFIYAIYLEMAPEYLKIGRTNNLERRLQEHRFSAAKANLPDAPKLKASWNVKHCKGAEKAVHGVLMLRAQHYQKEGSGTEWFKATVDDIQKILNFACVREVECNNHE